MAYCDSLDDERFVKIQSNLMDRASKEHDAEYNARVAKAKTKRQKRLCAGQYVGAWQRLLNAWLAKEVPNYQVNQCILAGVVIGDADGVSFNPS